MSRSLRKLFPSIAIGPAGIASELGVEWSPGAKLPCPRSPDCTTTGDDFTIPTDKDPSGGWRAGPCPRCGWEGSIFDLYVSSSKQTPIAALKTLRKRGVRVPRGCGSPRVIAAWERDRYIRTSLEEIRKRYASRSLTGPLYSGAIANLNLTKFPHNDPLWWCGTVYELSPMLGNLLTPASAADRRLGAATPDEAAAPTIIVPLYDQLFRLTGIAGYPSQANNSTVYVRRKNGDVSLGFLHTATNSVPCLGDFGLLTSCPTKALMLICSHLTISNTPPPVVYIPDFDRISSLVAALPKRPWVYVSGYRLHTPGQCISLLRRLDARVIPLRTKTIVEAAHFIKSGTMDWKEHMEECLFTLSQTHMNETASRSFLTSAGWDHRMLSEVSHGSSGWTDSNLRFAKSVMTPRPPLRRVTVAKELTVVETVGGWIWDETGQVLTEAYPSDVRVERVGGILRYKGLIVYGKTILPFVSRRFRRDPVAVIMATLLRAGIDPPNIHPRLVPHLAATALYFSKLVTS